MSDNETINILGLSASLRKGSFATKALRNAVELAPDNINLDLAELGSTPPKNIMADIPLYNEDERGDDFPAPVVELGKRVAQADALYISMSEYNHSMPGGFKNAIDWLSRLPDTPLTGKPFAIMSSSPGPMGGVRSQLSFRQTAVFLDMRPTFKPEVIIGFAPKKYDDDGKLTDDMARDLITKQLVALREYVLQLRD